MYICIGVCCSFVTPSEMHCFSFLFEVAHIYALMCFSSKLARLSSADITFNVFSSVFKVEVKSFTATSSVSKLRISACMNVFQVMWHPSDINMYYRFHKITMNTTSYMYLYTYKNVSMYLFSRGAWTPVHVVLRIVQHCKTVHVVSN